MSDFELFRAAKVKPKDRLALPVHAPQYQYLVCDLLTDQLLANIPLSSVTFDRRVSRVGQFSGGWKIPNREQAILADQISSGSGRYAIWVIRDDRVWWGGIIWNCAGRIGSRSYDTVTVQAATFDSYTEHRFLEADWFTSDATDVCFAVKDAWLSMQSFDNSDIGVELPAPTKFNNEVLPSGSVLLQSDQKNYADVVKLYTDGDPACQQTIDVTRGADGSRVKTLRVEADFAATETVNRYVISGYRIPSWAFTRDATKSGTVFRAWGNPQDGDSGSQQFPRASTLVKRQDLLDAGWPRLDISADIGEVPQAAAQYQPVLDAGATALRNLYGGIQDVVSFDVDLSTSEWHPNNIGQHVVIKRSKHDLWHPGETSVITPVVVQFSAPDREGPEQVTFTIDGAEEG